MERGCKLIKYSHKKFEILMLLMKNQVEITLSNLNGILSVQSSIITIVKRRQIFIIFSLKNENKKVSIFKPSTYFPLFK